MFDLDTRTQRVRSAVLAGTSTAFDILYELSGRRLDLLQRSAAWLYERAEGDHPELEPFQQAAAPQAPAPKPPAPEPNAAAPAAEPAAEAAPEPTPEPVQVATSEPEPAPEPFPIPGYDDLNVKVIVEALEALSPEALEAIRAYEAANKKRVTIDRAIKKLMEA